MNDLPDLLDDDIAKSLRKVTVQKVLNEIEANPAIFVSLDNDKVDYVDVESNSVNLPKKPGIFALYSRLTNRCVFVAETDNLRRQVNRECRPTQETYFKKQWLRQWLELPTHGYLNKNELMQLSEFIANKLYFKFTVLYFGRVEVCENLLGHYQIRVGANAIDARKEFE